MGLFVCLFGLGKKNKRKKAFLGKKEEPGEKERERERAKE